MIRFFGDNRPLVLFFLPFVVLGFHVAYHLSVSPSGPLDIDFGWWGNLTIKQGNTNLGYEILSGCWVLLNAILLNFTFNSSELNEKNTYLPALNFVVLSAISMNFYQFNGLHLASTAIILGLYQVLQLNQNKDGAARIFNAGFFIGIAATVYPPLITLIPFGVLLYLIFRPFLLREFYFYILGCLVPFLYLISRSYLFGFSYPTYVFDWNDFIRNFTLNHAINTAILISVFVISLFGVVRKLSTAGNRVKKEIQLINTLGIGIFSALFFCIFLAEPSIKIEYFIIPLSVLFTFPLLSKRLTFASSLLFYIFLLFGLLKFTFLNQLQ